MYLSISCLVDCVCYIIQLSFSHFLAVRRGDVLAAWSGIRPLVIDPNSKNTESIARNHLILVSKSGLVTIAGGKWTTYRSMAVDTMEAAIKACGLKPARECQTDGLFLEGGEGYSPNDFIRLVQDFGLEVEVRKILLSVLEGATSISKENFYCLLL